MPAPTDPVDPHAAPAAAPQGQGLAWEVFCVFLRLGLTSFGGPVAHLGYFRTEFVERRRWLDERSYADLVALCQFLPGPASSQVGIALGLLRARWAGSLAAWAGFTLPSAAALIALALGLAAAPAALDAGWLQGLKVAAVAVVAQAVWGMARTLCPDRQRAALAVGAALLTLGLPGVFAQLVAIVAAGALGWALLRLPGQSQAGPVGPGWGVSRRAGWVALVTFLVLLAGLPLAATMVDVPLLSVVDAFFRAGALVFGGGHVVLPLLQEAVVPPGWIDAPGFLAGYGAAQAVPGPLFTFAAYLGAAMPAFGEGSGGWPGGVAGGLIALGAIFVPAWLLVVAALPFWDGLRQRPGLQSALAGVNAGVVGILLAALYDPVWTSAILGRGDFALALAAFALLVVGRVAPLGVVALCALGGWALAALGGA
jgi:chromate transporter